MSRPKALKFDKIGTWSEVKLDIIRKYAKAYSTILNNKPPLYHVYIDAFAGAGVHLSKTREGEILGSPLIALNTDPPFREYHFIDLDGLKVENLRRLAGDCPNVHIHQGDCNRIMLECVLPRVRYQDYRRGLCLLDPYGLDLDWRVISTASQMGTIDLFLNFPVMDINRSVCWEEPEKVDAKQAERMNTFWGDGSWRQAAYKTEMGLFDDFEEKATNQAIATAFQQRLKKVAGFKSVPDPVPMRNSHDAVLYYLFFASQNPVAENIVTDIFNKCREQGAVRG